MTARLKSGLKFGVCAALLHLSACIVVIFFAAKWWGHGGSGAPDPIFETLLPGTLRILYFGAEDSLTFFTASPLFGLITAILRVLWLSRAKEPIHPPVPTRGNGP